jgi:hypothetical protein
MNEQLIIIAQAFLEEQNLDVDLTSILTNVLNEASYDLPEDFHPRVLLDLFLYKISQLKFVFNERPHSFPQATKDILRELGEKGLIFTGYYEHTYNSGASVFVPKNMLHHILNVGGLRINFRFTVNNNEITDNGPGGNMVAFLEQMMPTVKASDGIAHTLAGYNKYMKKMILENYYIVKIGRQENNLAAILHAALEDAEYTPIEEEFGENHNIQQALVAIMHKWPIEEDGHTCDICDELRELNYGDYVQELITNNMNECLTELQAHGLI